MVRNVATKTLSGLGITWLTRALLAPDGRFVLMFHGIAPRRYAGIPWQIQPWQTVEELRGVLRWLQPRYKFLTPHRFFAGEKDAVLLTFDDGLANNYVHALPVLTEFVAPAVFFVSTQHVIEPTNWLSSYREYARKQWGTEAVVPRAIGAAFWDGMSVEQLKICAEHSLITIGGHTVSHPRLTECPPSEVDQELVTSRRWLQDVTGQSVDLFAYPYGDYNRAVAEAVRDAGYRAAFADDVLHVGLPDYEIPRVGIYGADRAYLDVKLSGLFRRPV